MNGHENLQVWVGRVEVRPLGDAAPFTDAPGGFTTAVTEAMSATDFERRVGNCFQHVQLEIIGYANVEPLADRRRLFVVPDEVLAMAEEAVATGEVEYGPFFLYTENEQGQPS